MTDSKKKVRNATLLTVALMVATPLALLLSLKLGALSIDWGSVWLALSRQTQGIPATIVWELRLPRALTAFAVGGLLSLSGALLQVLLRNPLADPYILGVSGGAAVGALLSMYAGVVGGWVAGNAFIGALISMALVFGLAWGQGTWTSLRLLLTGVVVATGWGAIISLILALAPDANLQGMLFWIMGDLSRAEHPDLPVYTVSLGLIASRMLAPSLNVMMRGDQIARALGEHTAMLRLGLFMLASVMTAVAVSVAGSIAFVGLVVPHLLRLLGSSDHRHLVPQSMLLGGIYLVLADTLARSLLIPLELPVGVVTALLGVPLFLFLLSRSTRT